MRINNNLQASNATRQLNVNSGSASKSMEKLSSGYRINRAGDDAAGLAISEKMRGQIKGLNQASKNSQEGISLIQTAEGGLNESHSILQRMRELAVQASTGTLQDADRGQIDKEFQALKSEVGDIAQKTQFNKMTLLNGTFGSSLGSTSTLKVQAFTTTYAINATTGVVTATEGIKAGTTAGVSGIQLNGAKAGTYTIADDGANLVVTAVDPSANPIGEVTIEGGAFKDGAQSVNIEQFGITITTDSSFVADDGAGNETMEGKTIVVSGSSVDLQTGSNQNEVLSLSIGDMSIAGLNLTNVDTATSTSAQSAITSVEDAIKTVSDERAKLGATQNRLEYKIKNLDSSAENLQSAESSIRDVDMAKEMVEYTKNDILQQAAQAMLAKANQAPQSVLQLLR